MAPPLHFLVNDRTRDSNSQIELKGKFRKKEKMTFLFGFCFLVRNCVSNHVALMLLVDISERIERG